MSVIYLATETDVLLTMLVSMKRPDQSLNGIWCLNIVVNQVYLFTVSEMHSNANGFFQQANAPSARGWETSANSSVNITMFSAFKYGVHSCWSLSARAINHPWDEAKWAIWSMDPSSANYEMQWSHYHPASLASTFSILFRPCSGESTLLWWRKVVQMSISLA